jgi:hypothetical protein
VGIEEITTGYHGPSISKLEYDGALLLQRLLRARPWPILNNIRERFEGDFLGIRQLEVEIKLSPPKPFDDLTVSHETLIIAGGPIYNSYTNYYLNKHFRERNRNKKFFYFDRSSGGERAIKLHQEGATDSVLEGRADKVESAFVQRINDTEHQLTVFICAGLGASATYGCLRFLCEKWQTLQRDYDGKEFGIGLLFRGQDSNNDRVCQPEERPLWQNAASAPQGPGK